MPKANITGKDPHTIVYSYSKILLSYLHFIVVELQCSNDYLNLPGFPFIFVFSQIKKRVRVSVGYNAQIHKS